MIKIKQVVLLGPNDELPGHGMIHNWQLGKWPESFIDINELHKVASARAVQQVTFDKIASKPYTAPLDPDQQGYKRYTKSDINYPGYLVEMENPYSKQYRMIDGRRRLHKMKNTGLKSGNFIVFKRKEILPYIWHVLRTENLEALTNSLK